jgi:predicted nucleic acid-binding protein
LSRPAALASLDRLTPKLMIININPRGKLKVPASIRLDSKDQPILLAAIHDKADFLLTGDARYFGHLYGKRIEDVVALRPSQYFEWRRRV